MKKIPLGIWSAISVPPPTSLLNSWSFQNLLAELVHSSKIRVQQPFPETHKSYSSVGESKLFSIRYNMKSTFIGCPTDTHFMHLLENSSRQPTLEYIVSPEGAYMLIWKIHRSSLFAVALRPFRRLPAGPRLFQRALSPQGAGRNNQFVPSGRVSGEQVTPLPPLKREREGGLAGGPRPTEGRAVRLPLRAFQARQGLAEWVRAGSRLSHPLPFFRYARQCACLASGCGVGLLEEEKKEMQFFKSGWAGWEKRLVPAPR